MSGGMTGAAGGLTAEGLRVRYGPRSPRVLDGLSFSLAAGGLLAVLGPSGCGKTTLLGVLAGVVAPEAGFVSLGGVPLRPGAVSIGLIPQSYGLLPWKTVRDNCLFCARLRGAADEERLAALCRALGIADLLDRYPRALSGGQAQRAALARALLARPQLLLLDEPFAALDAAAAHRARELCLGLWRAYGFTAVAVTHRIEEALYIAGEIAVMQPGGRFALHCENPFQGLDDDGGAPRRALYTRLRDAVLAAGEGAGV